MDNEEVREVVEDGEESVKTVAEPLEVKVVNIEKKVSSVYDDTEDLEYENLYPTEEQIAEFEDGKSK